MDRGVGWARGDGFARAEPAEAMATVYGVPSGEMKHAMRLCARLEGTITDPVYEGESLQGMGNIVRKGCRRAGAKVVYAHLGGVPALNGDAFLNR